MKVMILSDSHTMNKTTLETLLKNNHVDYYIHCGDIYKPYHPISQTKFYLAKGNNDFDCYIHDELLITIDDHRFFITHGHRYGVSYSLEHLINITKEKKADIVCFGHTHRPYFIKTDTLTIINPGSVYYSRGAYKKPTYCIYDTANESVTFYDATTLSPCNPFV